jgi:transcriptional regulator with XRE-family HTH domain
MKESEVTLGFRVKFLRKKKGFSQAKFSRLVGLNRSFLSKIESNKDDNITFSTIKKICYGLDMSLRDFFDY